MREIVKRTLRVAAALFTALSLAVTSFAVSDIPAAEAADDTPVEVLVPVAEDRLPTGDLVIGPSVEIPEEAMRAYLEKKANEPDTPVPEADSALSQYDFGSKYYYNTFNSEEKALYDNLKTICENFYNGTDEPDSYVYGGKTIYHLDYVSYGSIGLDRAQLIVQALYWSEPRFFFLNGGNSYSSNGTITATISADLNTRAKIERYKSVIESLSEEWMTEINAVSDEAAREELIIKKICDRTMYHYNKQGQAVSEYNNQTIAGALVDQECVCNGYAMTMTYFANAAGLDCMLVVSAGHAWNIIKIDGVWYELDVTWTDQDRGCPNSANLIYDWVNKSHSTFTTNANHVYDSSRITTGTSTTLLTVPNCTKDRIDTVPTYTVTYKSDHFNPITLQARSGNSTPYLNLSGGYYVTGYYVDSAHTAEYDMNTAVTGDTTVYVTIENQPTTIPVYFETKCSVAVPKQTISKGGKVTTPSVNRTGFELEGWYTDFKCTSAYNFSSTVSTGMTLFARWTKKEATYYTVKFDSNGGSDVADATVEDGKTVTQPTDPTKEGFDFDGWYTDNTTFKDKYDFSKPVTSGFTLYAKWKEKQVTKYTVKFDSNGGSDVADATVEDGKTVTQPTDPTKEGFDFDGWYTDNTTFKDKYDFSKPVTSGFTLYAKWKEKQVTKYTVKFDTNGGSEVADATVEDGKTVAQPTDPTKDDHDFDGWYTDNTTFKDKYDFSKPVTSGFTLYAKWKEKQVTKYTVKFDSNGGSDVADATVEDGKTVTQPTDPTKEGFDFDGWYTDNTTFKNKYDFSTPVKSDFTLYAKWTEKQVTKHTVKFDTNGGSEVADATVEDGKTVAQPTDPTKDDYDFDGWYTDNTTFKNKYDFSTPVKSDFTLYAKWTEKQVTKHTVKFDTNGGSEVADATVEDGKTVAQPTDPTKDDHDFDGWYTDNTTFKNKYDFSAPVKSDFTLYAKWIKNEAEMFTVTFDSAGGSTVADQTVEKGAAAVEPEEPTREGYSFLGWYIGDTLFRFRTPITADITLTAKWAVKKYSVVFDSAGGTPVEMQRVEYGKTLTVPTVSKNGFELECWMYNGKPFNFSTPVTSDMTLTAKWTANKYTVRFIFNDVEYGTQSVPHGQRVTFPQITPTEGNKIVGWCTDAAMSSLFLAETPVTSALTLYAREVPIGGKVLENGEVIANDLTKAIESATGDSKVITLNEDDTVKSLKFPKNDTEIAIDGGGNTLEFTGPATIKPEQKLAVTDLTLISEKNGKKQNITINGAAAGLALENVVLDGKKVAVNTTKGDLVLNDVQAPNFTVKGNAKTNLSVGGDTAADTISGYGKVTVDGTLTIRKSLIVYDLVLGEGAVLNIAGGASVTIRSSISGSGTIHLANGFKPITLNGYASGRISLTSDEPLDDRQIFKSSAAALDSVFDVSSVVSDPAFVLIAKSGKVYLRRCVLRVDDRSYSDWADAMSDITKLAAKGAEYTVELLDDVTVSGTLKFPSKGKYAGLAINGNGHSIIFGGTSLSLTGSLTLKNVTVSAVKSGKPVKWTLKTNKFAFEQGNAVLENCTVK